MFRRLFCRHPCCVVSVIFVSAETFNTTTKQNVMKSIILAAAILSALTVSASALSIGSGNGNGNANVGVWQMKRCVIPALCVGPLSATALTADTTSVGQTFSMSLVHQTAGQYGQYIGLNVSSMDPLGSLGGNAGYKNTGSGNIGAFNS